VAEALGLPVSRQAARTFWAIRDFSIEVPRGQRLGIVGRNGAGKSTLLKIIAGLIVPTAGRIHVQGNVYALMELGTGFHPDFSGRDNVRSALAYLGITGKKASLAAEEIIEFAELEDFIDQPFRTYSSGMQARLTFTVATNIQPDVLIVDEILGAGDAYFTAKAVARMKNITRHGTTLLFVSHDLGSVQMMCDRAIWIDRGALKLEGDTLSVGKAYMASIREQEEIRLRAAQSRIRTDRSIEVEVDHSAPGALGRFVLAQQTPPRYRHPIRTIALLQGNEELERVDVGGSRDSDASESSQIIVEAGQTEWSDVRYDEQNVYYRHFEDCGGRFNHAPFSIRIPPGCWDLTDLSFEIVHRAVLGEDVRVELYDGQQYHLIGVLIPAVGEDWVRQRFLFPASLLRHLREDRREPDAGPTECDDSERPADVRPHGREQIESFALAKDLTLNDTLARVHALPGDAYGSGGAHIEDVRLTVDRPGGNGRDRRVFTCGEDAYVDILWEATRDISDCRLVIAIYGMDGRCATQVLSPAQGRQRGRYRDRAIFAPLRVGPGEYAISVGIFENLSITDKMGTQPLHVLDRRFLIRVMMPVGNNIEPGYLLHDVNWKMQAESDSSDAQ
jgi:lipopolysaccharide transport system ATP-binding protein